jgi:pyridoxal phosphate enzyme (YggS family)
MAAQGLIDARRRIAAAAARAGRDPADILLVVVSKGRSDDEVRSLYDAGHRVFAENRADALIGRLEGSLPGDIVWHFVGSVQRRKARLVAPRTALLHSMDREPLEATWAAQPVSPPVLLQVNLASEQQKQGYIEDEVLAAAGRLTDHGVAVHGLMVLPPAPQHPEDSRRWFSTLAQLGGELTTVYPGAAGLSMGMSDDFEVAVECGATMVRLGRTIFETGERENSALRPEV